MLETVLEAVTALCLKVVTFVLLSIALIAAVYAVLCIFTAPGEPIRFWVLAMCAAGCFAAYAFMKAHPV